jgi:hypothetical protein
MMNPDSTTAQKMFISACVNHLDSRSFCPTTKLPERLTFSWTRIWHMARVLLFLGSEFGERSRFCCCRLMWMLASVSVIMFDTLGAIAATDLFAAIVWYTKARLIRRDSGSV